jgi:hypothetical protein
MKGNGLAEQERKGKGKNLKMRKSLVDKNAGAFISYLLFELADNKKGETLLGGTNEYEQFY